MNIDSITNGFVIDHITAGRGMRIYELLGLDNLDCSVAIIKNVTSKKLGKKDIIKVDADIEIDFDGKNERKQYEGHACTSTQNRKIISVYKGNKLVGKFKKYQDVADFLTRYDIHVSETWVRQARNRGVLIHGFKIER